MSRSASKNKNRRESVRYGHKRARQATRRVLGGGKPEIARGVDWSGSIEQPPLPDLPVAPARAKAKKRGCKRNGYGPHIIEAWPQSTFYHTITTWDPAKGRFVREEVRNFAHRWHPPYRCEKCGKGFYSVPKRNAERKTYGERTYSWMNRENEIKDDHYDLYNIRCRLLGLACRCLTCNPENDNA